MAFYAYYRVSTKTQAEKGGGLEMQRQNVEKYCAENNITLAGSFTDAGISGAIKDTDDDEAIGKRHALIELLNTVREGDTVIVLNTSRLWRSDTAKVLIRRDLMKHHVKVVAVENPRFDLYARDPYGRFIDGIMEQLDELERETIALKLAKGRAAKATNGWKPAGVTPYGYRYTEDKKSIEVDPDEAQAVKMMFTEGQKGRSLRQIAAVLNDAGIPTRRGKEWSAGNVQAVLKNTFYTGELLHQGQPIKGNHTPIISKVQFGKVQAQLEKRKR